MICTCTMNPSLDYYMEFDHPVVHTRVNRSSLEYFEAGGKGINISIVLSNLQIPSRATGFLGGFVRDYYIRSLQKYPYIEPYFTYIEGQTRINVKLSDSDGESDLNAAGPYITAENMSNLVEKVERLDEGDYFVLAGTSPQYLGDEIEKMLSECGENKVKLCIDTNPKIMQSSLSLHPFLFKTTVEELEAGESRKITEKDAVQLALDFHKKGAENVVILFRKNHNAVYSCKSGTYVCHLAQAEEPVVNTVGAGDSLVAGFLMNYLRSRDGLDSFRYGCSAGSATVYSKGLAEREKIDSFYEKTEVRKAE